LLALSLSNRFIITEELPYIYEPFGNSLLGSLGNSLFLLLGSFFATIFIIYLIKFKKIQFLKVFLTITLSIPIFFLTTLSLIVVLSDFFLEIFVFVISLIFGAFVTLTAIFSFFIRKMRIVSIFLSIIISAEIGTFFVMIIRPPTILILPIIFAIYDIYAVFRGPLKKLIESDHASSIAPLSTSVGELQLGMGDSIFYSLMPVAGYLLGGILSSILVIISIHVGVIITLHLLSKRGAFPGLPIPVAFASLTLVPFIFNIL
jgi:hypothetical protein